MRQRLDERLAKLCESRPEITELDTIGTTAAGSPIPLVTVSTASDPRDLPGLWVEARAHGSEHTAESAAVALLSRLVGAGEDDELAQRALERSTFYIVPCLSPDGADESAGPGALAIRSRRSLPNAHSNYTVHDIDGDGKILSIRIADPAGSWISSKTRPGLMVARGPLDLTSEAYRMLPEGSFHGKPASSGLRLARSVDFNQSFPLAGRSVETVRPVEVEQLVQAVTSRSNSAVYFALHSPGGYHLLPDGCEGDQLLYGRLAAEAARISGLPCFQGADLFGDGLATSINWAYREAGLLSWLTEIWSVRALIGDTEPATPSWFGSPDTKDLERLHGWAATSPEAHAHVPWYPYEHSQLGPVELGGWDVTGIVRNCPDSRLDDTLCGPVDWMLWVGAMMPCLYLDDVSVQVNEPGMQTIRVRLSNIGALSTAVTDRWAACSVSQGVRVICQFDQDVPVSSSDPLSNELGQLDGYLGPGTRALSNYAADPLSRSRHLEWTVPMEAAARVTISATHPRAKDAHVSVDLSGS